MDSYGKTFLPKVAHIFILYHPLKERKSVSVTKHKKWVLEISPKMSVLRGDFTFLARSPDPWRPGQNYLTGIDHHGCRNLGIGQSGIFWIFMVSKYGLREIQCLLIHKTSNVYCIVWKLCKSDFLKTFVQFWWQFCRHLWCHFSLITFYSAGVIY